MQIKEFKILKQAQTDMNSPAGWNYFIFFLQSIRKRLYYF